eukprot:jgi/Hompol1/1064/HPOL_001352-RA
MYLVNYNPAYVDPPSGKWRLLHPIIYGGILHNAGRNGMSMLRASYFWLISGEYDWPLAEPMVLTKPSFALLTYIPAIIVHFPNPMDYLLIENVS